MRSLDDVAAPGTGTLRQLSPTYNHTRRMARLKRPPLGFYSALEQSPRMSDRVFTLFCDSESITTVVGIFFNLGHYGGIIMNALPGQWDAKAPDSAAVKGGKTSRLFILGAGVLLLATGAAKIVSALGSSAVLAKPDPIFGIHFNYLLLAVGLIELVVASFCFTSANQVLVLQILALLSINFAGYRIGLWLGHWKGYCPCLGTLTQAIHLSRRQANLSTLIILIYLLAGSLFFLACRWWVNKGKRVSDSNSTLISESLGQPS
jgi:hypothetical protein